MPENKYLNFILTEGILLLFLGMGMLILPKITMISFGFLVCISFIIYGGYKVITSFLTRNLSRHYVLDIFAGLILLTSGVILFFAPVVDVMIIIGLVGIYFILKCISSSAFSVQTRKILNFWWLSFMLGLIELFFSLVIILSIPSGAIWFVGVITGVDFIINGIVLVNMYISTSYLKQV